MSSCSKKENKSSKTIVFPYNEYNQLLGKQKKQFLDSLYKVVETVPNNEQGVKYLFDLSSEYYYINESSKSFKVSEQILKKRKSNDSLSLAKAYYYMGDSYEVSHRDSAFFYYLKAEKIYRLLNNNRMIAKMQFNKAYLLFFEGNYIESEILVSNALNLLKEKNSDKRLIFESYNLLGANFDKLEEYDSSLKYYMLAKNLLKDSKLENKNIDRQNNLSLQIVVNIANILEKKLKFTQAKNELKQLVKNEYKKKWPLSYATVIGNLGCVEMKLGNLKSAEQLLKTALNISQANGNDLNIVYKLNNLGDYYTLKKDTLKSVYYLKKTLKIAEKIQSIENIKNALKSLAKLDPENNTYYYEKYIYFNDSLAKTQRKINNKYARIAYETSVIEDENKILTKNNLYLLISSFILIVLFIGILVFRYWKNKRKELEFQSQLQSAEIELFELMQQYQIDLNHTKVIEQNRISKELHDSVTNKLLGVHLVLKTLNESNEIDIKEKRKKYIEEIHAIENEIREITHDLRTEEIDPHFDFKMLLLNCIQQADEMGTTRFNLDCNPMIDWESVSGLIKITLYRIIQEALSNVSKYAEASECQVVISIKDKQTIDLLISDNGRGFDKNTIITQGIGLKNMKERAEKVKSNLSITTQLGEGTQIQCSFTID